MIKKREKELEEIIEKESLKPQETKKFMDSSFRDGEIKSTGTALVNILPAIPMFLVDKSREKRNT